MAITNGYATLANFKYYASPSGGGFDTNANDDAIIEKLIESASRKIDDMTARTFYARTETHYFDVPPSRKLWLDDDLLSLTTLTNGDGTVISSANYALIDYNKAPYYAVKLLDTSSTYWQSSSSGGAEKVISIAGSWGYSATAPTDIEECCLAMAKHAYNRRTGQGEQAARITAMGVVLSPADMPGWVREVLNTYKRRT